MAPTSDERREVAARLREAKRECESRGYPWMVDDLILALGCYEHDYEADDSIFDRLADLIEPNEPDVIRCGQCDYCVLNDCGELWCMRDPNHTGHGCPTNKDGFCCWAEPMEDDYDDD